MTVQPFFKNKTFQSLEYEAQFFSHCAVIGCYYGRPGGAFTIQNTIFEMRDSRFEIQYLDWKSNHIYESCILATPNCFK